MHTPGPWTFKEIPVWTPSEPTDGIPFFQCSEYGGRIWLQRAKANARLIAAAPELLAELRFAVKRIEIANAEGDSILSAWLPGARATIESATVQTGAIDLTAKNIINSRKGAGQ